MEVRRLCHPKTLFPPSDMDSSLYGNLAQQLELFIASGKSNVDCVATKSSRGEAQFVGGLYQDEESVDFSALVEACERSSTSPHLNTTGSATFLDPTESAFPFETELLPTTTSSLTTMYGTENGGNSTTLDISLAQSSSVTQSTVVIDIPSVLQPGSGSSLVKGTPRPAKAGTKRRALEKGTFEYREKRNRNNMAVKKSRNKSKQRILETEQRVKELEDENAQLQNKIALLTKELNVLKSLFSSAGVPQPSSLKVDQVPLADTSGKD